VQVVVGHAAGSDEAGEAEVEVGPGSFASTAGQMGGLVPTRSATAAQLDAEPLNMIDDIVDEWGRQSFPASDPPSNW
jgi:hypothetical protein